MTKRPKEVYGKKLIYRYSAPVIFTLLFSLLAIACFVLTLFLPIINGEVPLNGMHYVNFVINLFTGGANTEIDYYTNNVVSVVLDNFGLALPIVQVWMFIMAFDLAIMAIFAVILAIAGIVMILSGRLKHWKLPYRCIAGMLYPAFFFYGTVIGLNIYAALIKHVAYYDGLYSYIFLGVLFISTIITHIIYSRAFKDHVYVKNQRTLNMYIDEYEREHVVVDTSVNNKDDDNVIIEQAPKIVYVPAEDQTKKNDSSDNRKRLPKGLKHIGGHAFCQNTALEEADIPLGIEVLGAGAFANCVNLRVVHIPESVKKIEYNCFFNCIKLEKITYGGSREMWKRVKRGSNWLTDAGTKFVVCIDGALAVDPKK